MRNWASIWGCEKTKLPGKELARETQTERLVVRSDKSVVWLLLLKAEAEGNICLLHLLIHYPFGYPWILRFKIHAMKWGFGCFLFFFFLPFVRSFVQCLHGAFMWHSMKWWRTHNETSQSTHLHFVAHTNMRKTHRHSWKNSLSQWHTKERFHFMLLVYIRTRIQTQILIQMKEKKTQDSLAWA